MAGLDPATPQDRVCGRKDVFYARGRVRLGGRLKGGHDDMGAW
jgi:hypothetical protein